MMIEHKTTQLFTKITRFVKGRFVDHKSAVEMLLELVIQLMIVLIYHLSKSEPRWSENPIVEAYLKLNTIKKTMLERERISVINLPVEEDETLRTWYSQEEAGVSEKERVVLSPEQHHHIQLDKKLEKDTKKLPPAEIAYNKRKPAVSMVALEKAV